MAVRSYREKRQTRKRSVRTTGKPAPPHHSLESARLIPLGTIASLVPEVDRGAELSVRIAGRYEVYVGSGFQPATLARLVRTLEQLA